MEHGTEVDKVILGNPPQKRCPPFLLVNLLHKKKRSTRTALSRPVLRTDWIKLFHFTSTAFCVGCLRKLFLWIIYRICKKRYP